METAIRNQRDILTMAKAAGDGEEELIARTKIRQLTDKYAQLSEVSGLPTQVERTKLAVSAKTVDKSRGSGIMKVGLNRDVIDSSNVEPMPQEQFKKIQKAFERRGGYFKADKEANDYVTARRKDAITFNADTVLFRYNPSRAAVFEELIHTYQYKIGKFDGSDLSRFLCEIEAKEKLLKYAKAYKLTDKEIEITRRLLELDRHDLAMLKGVD